MYEVVFSGRAERDFKHLDIAVRNRTAPAIHALSENPRPVGCLKVKDTDGLWRIRVGDYRIGYTIDETNMQVNVIRIGHRKEFYR